MKKFISGCMFLLSLVCQAQEQDAFEDLWRKTDSLELVGRTATADSIVQEIIDRSMQKNRNAELLKAKLYHYKFHQLNHEDSEQYILDDVNRSIANLPVPYSNLLQSYKAEFLEEYFSSNRYRMRNRSEVVDPEQTNLLTWSLPALKDSILGAYSKSLENKEILIETPVEDIAVLLNEKAYNRDFQPSLLDLVSRRALELYSDSSFFTEEFGEEDFDWKDPKLMSAAAEFTSIDIPQKKTSAFLKLNLYQNLEAMHLDNKQVDALIYWSLERMKFIKEKADSEATDSRFVEVLKSQSDKYAGRKIQAYIQYELANQYYLFGNAEDRDPDANWLPMAVEITDSIIENHPNTQSAQNARRLRTAIKMPSLDSKIPEFLAPQEYGRIFLSYKNVDSLYVKIGRIPFDIARNYNYRQRDSLVKRHASKINDSSLVVLPGPEDHQTHSTEVLLKGQPAGSYLVYLSDPQGNNSYGFYQVSSLSVSETRFDQHTVLNVRERTNGKPVGNTEVISQGSRVSTRNWGKTNTKGKIRVNNQGGTNWYYFNFIKDKDTLFSPYSRNRYYRNSDDREMHARTLFFLDRGIYRPGQTVHFKGVLLKNENDSTSTVPNEFVPVYIEDPNGSEIEEFRYKTNEYGSFTGSFKIPETGITGEFNIYSEEDTDSETPFWNEIWDEGEYFYNYTGFSVEEYKRPSFEVVFDSINKSFELNEEVSISGNVSSLMGAPIPDVWVNYEIKRERFVNDWWYRYYSEEVVIETDSVTTDENGDFNITFKAIAEKDLLDDPDLIYRYSISASATDITGETREKETSVKLGNKNLLAVLEIDENFSPGDSINMSLSTTNLNDNRIPVTGEFRIFKLRSPASTTRPRLWYAPEFNLISKEEFKRYFPEEPYEEAIKPEEQPKEELVYEANFESTGLFEDEIRIPEDWKPGNYLIEVDATNNSSTTSLKKLLRLSEAEKDENTKERLLASVLNEESIRQDENISLKILTAYKDLVLNVSVYDGYEEIYSKDHTVNRKKLLNIPLKNFQNNEILVQISGIYQNSVLEIKLNLNLEQEAASIQISTKTFRNKIQPGIEETWSFSIRDDKDRIPDTEILASMYDASLDQFKKSNWKTDPGFYQQRTYFPTFTHATTGQVENFKNNFPRIYRYRTANLSFDQLSSFGFNFGINNDWQYRRYINQKKNESKKLEGNIRGVITDEDGLPLPGVTVIITGTTTGTTTNFDGEFALNAKVGDYLTISNLGFTTEEVLLVDTRRIYISLREDSAALDEVVVVNYDQEAMEETPMMLAGAAAGLEMQAGEAIQIRGMSSENGETPLYVVDGKITTEIDLVPNDILSMEVLKGAEATALYGARAKNGVVIITTKAGVQQLENVETRKNLDETAFFFPDLKLNESGELEFSFTTPEALSSWRFRLLAHTRDWTTSKLQKTVQTQKELSINPNPPRFLREGDSIIFKAKISNLSSETLTGNATLKLFNAINMQPVDLAMENGEGMRSFSVKSSQSEVVTWKLYVPDTIPAVTYRVLASAGDFSDGEENMLPVLKNRMLVKESIPLFVRSGETENFSFESLRNQDSESLQNHLFSFEYTSNPAWFAIQSLPYLMEYEHECSEQIFSRIFANSIGHKIVSSNPKIADVFESWKENGALESELDKNKDLNAILLNETPWVMDAKGQAAQKQRVGNLFDTNRINQKLKENIQKLRLLQNSSGAFPWFSRGRDNWYITQYIVSGMARLKELGIELEAEEVLRNAISYLDSEFRYRESQLDSEAGKKAFYGSRFALRYLHARKDHLNKFEFPANMKSLVDSLVRVQKKNWLELPLYDKAQLALVLEKFGENETAKNILISLKEQAVRSDEYGMYWKENQSSWFFSRTAVETQAKIIEAFDKVLKETESIEEMKIWLLQNKRTNHWSSTKATTQASYALLMSGNDWLEVSENTAISLGGKPLPKAKLEATEKEAGTGYFRLNWQAEEITKDLGDIQIKNENTSPGFGGAYWQYFEDLDKIKDHNDGPLSIEKELYLNRNGLLKKIDTQTPLKLGDLVSVRLIVRSSANMDFIHLKDMRASGFEPTDVLSEYKYQDGTAYYQSTRDAATHFFFDSLPKGTYVLEYTLRANNAGTFSNGITSIESMYAPEFSGHTKGIKVEIRE
ncbi:MG2 domain-containing protein [Gramella sp. GC03-9]|uniref:MG2 domain-containing protein n=1 Tax=Christiangramia oceanisediminis TaxID=2920386 RepID=A0A9X2R9H1_9FLAO|nr:MG2 domain-containing protein [Gramella oceanisediminis]MCP9200887.1 MG2 domain-containing protein [Gramella oceanisediminis]